MSENKMKERTLIALILAAIVPAAIAGTQARRTRSRSTTPAVSPEIRKVVAEISAQRIESNIKSLVGFYTRSTLSETESDTRGIGAARRWIKSEFDRYSQDSGGRLKVEMDQFTQPPGRRNPKPVEVVNVVATLPGVQSESRDRIYVVSGHYDSRVSNVMDTTSFAPGADDDASGAAAVMEMARVMSKHQFNATLVFLTVAGEEQGLFGSTHWAQMARDKHLDIQGMITNDIIGSSRAEDGHVDNRHVRLFAQGLPPTAQLSDELRTLIRTGGENDTPTREFARKIKEVGDQYVRGMEVTLVYRLDRFLRGGDHSPFVDRGFPAVRMTEPNEIYQHQHQDVRQVDGVQYGDLPEFDDYAYIAQVARVNAAALADLALAPAAPKNVEVDTIKLENDTSLRWEAGHEPDLAGYNIVWRETTAPFWQHRIYAGNVTGYTVKGISKDNYIFGVEAVGKNGTTSPAVYPKPNRPAPRPDQS
jgi:hypothetical protein